LKQLAREYDDPLFHWELTNSAGNPMPDFVAKPGFTAALGWALFQFPVMRSQRGTEAVNWLAEHLQSDVAILQNNPNASHVDVDLLVSRYSTFLQWAIRLEMEHPESPILEKWANLIPSESSDVARSLRVVLEDEIIWADTLEDVSMHTLQAADRLRQLLETDDPTAPEWDEVIGANRLFSLTWHNEWMERQGFLSPAIQLWIERCGTRSRLAIKNKPDILDFNLQYHWLHFITQHGAWMRSWCFSENPDKYERDRVAPGSGQEKDNVLFFDIIREMFNSFQESDAPAERFRNGLMLLGTRTSRLPNQDSLVVLPLSLRVKR